MRNIFMYCLNGISIILIVSIFFCIYFFLGIMLVWLIKTQIYVNFRILFICGDIILILLSIFLSSYIIDFIEDM